MGNDLAKEYNIEEAPTGTGGHQGLFRIYPAVNKKTNEQVSVWLFDKEASKKADKKKCEVLWDVLRKEVTTVAKLKHPYILRIVVPLKEDKKTLAFVTEPILCSLGNAIKDERGLLPNLPKEVKEYDLSHQEVKTGLQQISEALQFCHKEGQLIHRNLTHDSILITPKGIWKLAGFGFSVSTEAGGKNSERPLLDPKLLEVGLFDYDLQPSLDYVAPEIVEGALAGAYDHQVDTFSLGVLIYRIFNLHTPLFKTNRSISAYKEQLDHLRRPFGMGSVPPVLAETLALMIKPSTIERCSIEDFLASKYFHDVLTRVLRYLENIIEKSRESKIDFFKALPQVLSKFDEKIIRQKVLPVLISELKNDTSPYVLPNLIFLLKRDGAPRNEFTDIIWPALTPIIAANEPPGAVNVLNREVATFVERLPSEQIRDHIVLMINNALESGFPELNQTVFDQLTSVVGKIDASQLKNNILPRLMGVFLRPQNAGNLPLKVNSLITLSKIYSFFEKDTVIDKVIPFLNECVNRDPSPAILMSVLGVHSAMFRWLPARVVALDVIPFLVPLSYHPGLSQDQFKTYIQVIRDMMDKIAKERFGPAPGSQMDTSILAGAGAASAGGAGLSLGPAGPGGRPKDKEEDWSNISEELKAESNAGLSTKGSSLTAAPLQQQQQQPLAPVAAYVPPAIPVAAATAAPAAAAPGASLLDGPIFPVMASNSAPAVSGGLDLWGSSDTFSATMTAGKSKADAQLFDDFAVFLRPSSTPAASTTAAPVQQAKPMPMATTTNMMNTAPVMNTTPATTSAAAAPPAFGSFGSSNSGSTGNSGYSGNSGNSGSAADTSLFAGLAVSSSSTSSSGPAASAAPASTGYAPPMIPMASSAPAKTAAPPPATSASSNDDWGFDILAKPAAPAASSSGASGAAGPNVGGAATHVPKLGAPPPGPRGSVSAPKPAAAPPAANDSAFDFLSSSSSSTSFGAGNPGRGSMGAANPPMNSNSGGSAFGFMSQPAQQQPTQQQQGSMDMFASLSMGGAYNGGTNNNNNNNKYSAMSNSNSGTGSLI